MNEGAVPAKTARVGRIAVQLLVTGVVTWFILRAVGLNFEQIRELDLSGWAVSWGMAGFASLVLLVAYLYSAALWGLMVWEIGGREIPVAAGLRVFFTANLGRYLPGKLWQIAGLAYLARAEGIPASTATGAAVLGQTFSLAGATLVGAGVLLRGGGSVGPGGVWAVILLLAILAAFSIPPFLRRCLGLWFRMARSEIPEGIRTGTGFGLRWLGLYALAWVLQGLAFWMLVRSFGLALSGLEGIPAYPAAYVLGYIALFAPAGIGVREGVLTGLLGAALGTGALAVAVIARLWTTVIELLLAVTLAGGSLTRGGGAGV